MAGMVTGAGGPGPGGPWPRLREELRLYPGPPGPAGEPSWTLHDPPAQRFFRFGWMEVEILNRWRLGSPEGIARSIASETTLRPHPAMVDRLKNFLLANNLTMISSPADYDRLNRQVAGRKMSLLSLALKNYLFIRIPLLKPDGFLSRTVDGVEWVFGRWFACVMAVLAVAGFYLIGRQWETFRDTFASLLTLQGGLLALAALGVSKAAHEMGHAYATKSLGLRVPSMGFSLMCFAPVLWTDTTEAWKVASRRDRLFIGVSGVYFELCLAVAAALAWPLLSPGPLKTVAFMTASSAWILTLAVNINPCMRYDGYYLLSDYWNVPGLQTRSFALAKWWLREWLFGFGLAPPEQFSAWDRFKLIAYAFWVWVYRFFLFLGIAFMVYYLFFKALGAVLMLVELGVFIALPILKEIRHWYGMRKLFTFGYKVVRTALLFAALGFAFAYPWHSRVLAPGMLYAERQALFFAPMGALLDAPPVAGGQAVNEGDLLFRLRSPDLDSRIDLASRGVANQRLKLSFASLDATLRAEMASDWEDLSRQAEDLGGLLAQRADLEMRAPFPGVMHDVPPWLLEDTWVASREALGVLTGGGALVAAYVSERDWNRVSPGASGIFYPSGKGWAPVAVEIVMKESQATTEIAHPELASVLGGPLPVHRDPTGRLVPEESVYRVMCRVADPSAAGRFAVGTVNIEAEPRSIAAMAWNNLVGLLVRESNW